MNRAATSIEASSVWNDAILASIPPMIALIGAVLLYFAQRKSDRKSEERKERLSIYVEMLRLMDDPRYQGLHLDISVFKEYLSKLNNSVWLVTLSAPHAVAEAAREVLKQETLKSLKQINQPEIEVDFDFSKSLFENIAEGKFESLSQLAKDHHEDSGAAKRAMILEMRKDLMQGKDSSLSEMSDLLGEPK